MSTGAVPPVGRFLPASGIDGSMPARRSRGKLKIFLGYAPGVGKTYAMLDAARQRVAEGVDTVVACISTHAQLETEELLRGMEIIPRERLESAGTVAAEMDLDAVLARRPDLALADDLSHTNAAGARHPKRYLDVEELLDAGIDVYTALDVHHLASLNDVVAQITGVVVADTVPDRLLDEADEIELVDVPPAELIRRLQEGKVDVAPAELGVVEDFYRPGNLVALRELALRRAAERVDRQMRSYMHARDISGPWAAGERLLVCLGPGLLSERVVRTGRRLAAALSAEWFAVYVETPAHARLAEGERDRVASAMRLAEALGARTLALPGRDVVETLLQYARQHNITKIVAGKPRQARWRAWFSHAVADRLIEESGEIDVYVISTTLPAGGMQTKRRPKAMGAWSGYLLSAGLVAVTTGLGHLAGDFIQPINFVILYLLPVIISAVRWGLGPSILASVLSVLAFDFFFVSPQLTFAVYDTQYLLTFIGLLLVGLVVSTLAAREREQAEAARRRALFTATLYDLSRDLAAASGMDAITHIVVGHVSQVFGREAGILLLSEKDGSLVVRASTPRFVLDAPGTAATNWAYEHGRPAGSGTETHAAAAACCLPLKTARGVIGVLVVSAGPSAAALTPEQLRLLEAFASQAALGIERARLAESKALEAEQQLQRSSHLGKLMVYLRALGPGLITGASDDDPSGIGTYAQTGAQYGYSQLWTAVVSFPLMTVVQEMCARIAMETGSGLADVLRRYYSRPLMFFCIMLLFVANTINVGADLGAMAAAGTLLLPIPFIAWLLAAAAIILALVIFVHYRQYARLLRFLTLSLFAYVAVVLVVRQDWGAALHGTVLPSVRWNRDYLLNLVAILGTTISPYLFFWQANEEVEEEIEEGKDTRMQRRGVSHVELKWMRTDVTAGMLLSNLVMWFIIVTAASTLGRAGITQVDSAPKAAEALKPVAGSYASLLFATGIIGTGMLAVPVLAGAAAYALSDALRQPQGLGMHWRRAPFFYGVIVISALIGVALNLVGINPMKALYYTAVLNGLVAPPLLFMIMVIANNRKIMRDRVNGRGSNLLGWTVTFLMTLAAAALIFTLVAGS